MKKAGKLISLLTVITMFLTIVIPPQNSFAAAGDTFIRVNQVGYKSKAAKTAMVLTGSDLKGKEFTVHDSKGNKVYTGKVGIDKGNWGDLGKNYAHTYELDFSSYTKPGTGYKLKVKGFTSPEFTINDAVYDNLDNLSLEFFSLQRCGDTEPKGHEACHLDDGIVVSGVTKGKLIDVSGGWHDAADYIKFMSTIGYCSNIMLSTYLNDPEQFKDPARGILAETKVGLDFMVKMWDNENQVLYLSVADADEHGGEDNISRWETYPEKDNFYKGPRPVYPCEPGKGANIAGKAAAALAMGAKIWGDPKGPCYNQELADTYLTAAKQIYNYGKNNPATMSDRDGGYEELPEEWAWMDDMALAGAELYRTTGMKSYLTEAKNYADTLGDNSDGDYSNINLSWSRCCHYVNYELAKLDASYAPIAAVRMYKHLNTAQGYSDSNVWGTGLNELRWGSGAMMSQLIVEASMFKSLTGDNSFIPLAQKQADYLLGSNPWGVSFLNGAGTTFVRHPRHRITYQQQVLKNNPKWDPTGLWSEGPVSEAVYTPNQNDPLDTDMKNNNNYTEFQDKRAVWHDNRMDYVTNEACINANAAGVAAMAWLAATDPGIYRPKAPGTQPSTPVPSEDEYQVSEDSYVRDGEYEAVNYGTESTLAVKGDPDPGYSRRALIKADLSKFTKATAASAVLKIYNSSANSSTSVKVYGLSEDKWTEKAVTWANQPGTKGAVLIGTLDLAAEGWYTIDITSYVNSQLAGDKTVSFVLQNESADGISTAICSKDGIANKPVLIVK
ncbi:glycoside hydrolase family 9 protein [Ruminiclostridium cellobioparum]|uniref:Glycosyl hydrolase family 9/N-terminal ig-like domain of cellulase n=1 Tax=Ruminiclostridium cellobioparum subsp. termitidis CT1112 TaxID=1195236 RepID=S0FIU6_RUMCE|nr:glycoside hydrolase family 9 protein [Ruminiclostridium cellobioparum]EMS70126.1 Glycosyl hydrolase family 9/N-terminal ig-like domain of cellulase [Ruminiclostridium cellobioparum subsp. termitidis CT1112]